jgi:hypothetical protein
VTKENLTLLKILRKLSRIEKLLTKYSDKNEAEHKAMKEEIERLKQNIEN